MTGRPRSTSCSSTRAGRGRSPTRRGGRRSAASAARPASTCARSTARPGGTRIPRSTPGRSARSSSRSSPGSAAPPPRCRTPRASAAPAPTSARSGSTSRGSSSTSVRRSCAGRDPGSRVARCGCSAGAFSSAERYERAQRTARALQRPALRDERLRWLPGPLAGWGRSRTLPGVAEQTFREWWETRDDGA